MEAIQHSHNHVCFETFTVTKQHKDGYSPQNVDFINIQLPDMAGSPEVSLYSDNCFGTMKFSSKGM